MGFILPIRKIVAAMPKSRQTVLFSATMPDTIVGLANSVLHQPVRVEVTPPSTTVERIDQKVLFVDRENKRSLLTEMFACKTVERALIFTRTKHGANRVAEMLDKAGIPADAIHGNKSQGARQKALADFKDGRIRALVATDIAARGIDVDGITHVVNFELPNEPESYVHRIGRTARAGASGIALSLCDADEVGYLRDIEKTIRQAVPVDYEHAYHAPHIASRGAGGKPKPRPQARHTPSQARPQQGRGNNPHGEHGHGPAKARDGAKPAHASGRPAQQSQTRSGQSGFKGMPSGSRNAARG
jgi:ATP-dependent RNA helicase RhlE